MRLTLNPWARHPLPGNPIGVDRSWLEDDRLCFAEGRAIREILGLGEHWPEGEDAANEPGV
jgi:hypothetical protein